MRKQIRTTNTLVRRLNRAWHRTQYVSRNGAAFALQSARAAIAIILICCMVQLEAVDARAQEVPPPQQHYFQLDDAHVDQLVAPIALYPDALVAQVLAGATYPPQIAEADQFVQRHAGTPPEEFAHMVDAQPWDPSVKALTAFPSVLANLDRNLDWTSRLGNAYYNQPQAATITRSRRVTTIRASRQSPTARHIPMISGITAMGNITTRELLPEQTAIRLRKQPRVIQAEAQRRSQARTATPTCAR